MLRFALLFGRKFRDTTERDSRKFRLSRTPPRAALLCRRPLIVTASTRCKRARLLSIGREICAAGQQRETRRNVDPLASFRLLLPLINIKPAVHDSHQKGVRDEAYLFTFSRVGIQLLLLLQDGAHSPTARRTRRRVRQPGSRLLTRVLADRAQSACRRIRRVRQRRRWKQLSLLRHWSFLLVFLLVGQRGCAAARVA